MVDKEPKIRGRGKENKKYSPDIEEKGGKK